tara:strand:+ start:6699 stop:9542 length:2844 start_codon:yes stop_codon:yes gene_type:complete
MALSNPPVNANVDENWLFDFTADNNNCLDFDGSNDTINFGNILSTPFVNFTIEFWCKADAVGGGVVIGLSSGSGESEAENVSFNVNLQSGGEFQLFYEYGSGSNESNTTSSFNLSADTWTHVAVVRDDSSGEAYFYKNGTLVETESASNDPTGGTSSDANMTIGNNFLNNNGYNGELAHIRVWNTARNASEISNYYNRLVDSDDSGLVGYWKLDEGSSTSAYDSSSNSNTGTISGATWSIGGFDQFIHAFGLSFRDTTVSSNFYHGSILNQNITIRDSIDITNGTSKTGNISVTSANFDLHGTDVYKLLFNGTNNYHNKEVRVYAQFHGEGTLSNCQRIFTGRIVDVTLDQNQNVTMQINTHRPWDGIDFPQKRHSTEYIYEPVVYGAFNYSDHEDASYGGLYPVPLIITEDLKIKTLMPRSYTSGDNNYLHYYVGQDYFLSMASASTSGGTEAEATAVDGGVNVLSTPVNYYAKGYMVPQHGNDLYGRTELTDPENAFKKTSSGDWDTDSFSSYTHPGSSTGVNRYLQMMTVPAITENTKIRKIKLRHGVVHTDGSGSGQFYQVDFFKDGSSVSGNRIYDNSTDGTTGTVIGTASTGSNIEYALQTAATCPTEINLNYINDTAAPSHVSEAHTLKLFGVKIFVSIRFWKDYSGGGNSNNAEDYNNLNKIKFFYCGGPGLTASWDSGAILHGHDAHRDLLQRFAGISGDDPENWSSLNTDRAIDNWKIRYWQMEPTSLKENLDKLAMEFGFNYKIDASGKLKYIHLKKSSELSASVNLTSQDIDKVSLKTTGLDSVITKWEIANNKHPAPDNKSDTVSETSGRKSGYYTFNTISNTNRVKFNLGDKEGIRTINLDYNIGTIPSSADSDCNADWYSYYNNIMGDMKILVSCDVVNPMKGCQLETGDIITFTDMPVEMFGTNFSTSKYYMVIETKRSMGKVSIQAREVG